MLVNLVGLVFEAGDISHIGGLPMALDCRECGATSWNRCRVEFPDSGVFVDIVDYVHTIRRLDIEHMINTTKKYSMWNWLIGGG